MNNISSRFDSTRLLFASLLIGIFASCSFAAADMSGSFESAEQSAPVQSQSAPITGDWQIEFTRKEPDQVQLTMTRGTGRAQNWGKGVLIRDLQGLSREQALHAPTDVTLRLAREAGTFELVGSFHNGKGTGRWTLTPNENFISSMRSRGYNNLTDGNLFSAAMADIKINSIDELKAAGYEQLSFDEIIESSIFTVTPEFIRDLKAAGFESLPFKKLVEARIFKVDAHFASEVEAMGLGKQPLSKLVEMRIFKVTPEYVSEMRSAGFDRLTLSQLVEFRIFKVTPEFINELRAEGYSSVSSQQAVTLRIHKVDVDFIRRAKAQGYANPTLDQLVDLRIHRAVK